MKKVEKNKENIQNCSCPKCPSYNECSMGKNENVFCSDEEGKTECQFKLNGCVCRVCLVHKQLGLTKGYYCIHGPASMFE